MLVELFALDSSGVICFVEIVFIVFVEFEVIELATI